MTPKAPEKTLVRPAAPQSSHDPMDVLMGDVVSFDEDDYGLATHVLIGCPQDEGVKRNGGRPGAAQAPETVRRFLYKLKPPVRNGNVRLLDLGDVPVGSLEEMHDTLHAVVRHALGDGKIVMVLGGGNDISFPDARAVSEVHPGFAAINVDAHLDMRKSDVIHSGTPYRNLIDGGHLKPTNLYEIANQPWANSPRYMEDAEALGVHVETLSTIQSKGPNKYFYDLFERLRGMPLFAGLDMDSVKAADAPGVSAPASVGLSSKGLLYFADRCRKHGRTAVFEITEVNPAFDVDDRTSRLAALTLYTFMFGQQ
ncbi:formimidoylglutamase [Pseudodesulfovibrio sp. zrk46]|uniref:formimidoylglutamase n=1 Tax=Pseudodesulfovibrio sp. zrk46 TaxID=2725288 RepID=UPI0014499D29|nr:formimidoylglutamase [Pseudodesulfovibrio sp. zrk46]QJB56283.1 formimidoylglutamase [Pseudodesulfovibrio sp. zrk46]